MLHWWKTKLNKRSDKQIKRLHSKLNRAYRITPEEDQLSFTVT